MRILVSNQHLPGYTSEVVPVEHQHRTHLGVLEVRNVYDPAGNLIGQISYETRRRLTSTLYGWSIVGANRNGHLYDKLDAIRKLIEDRQARLDEAERSKVRLSELEPGEFFAFHPNDKTCIYLGKKGTQHRSQGCTLAGEKIPGLTYLSDDQDVLRRWPKPAGSVDTVAVAS